MFQLSNTLFNLSSNKQLKTKKKARGSISWETAPNLWLPLTRRISTRKLSHSSGLKTHTCRDGRYQFTIYYIAMCVAQRSHLDEILTRSVKSEFCRVLHLYWISYPICLPLRLLAHIPFCGVLRSFYSPFIRSGIFFRQ